MRANKDDDDERVADISGVSGVPGRSSMGAIVIVPFVGVVPFVAVDIPTARVTVEPPEIGGGVEEEDDGDGVVAAESVTDMRI